MPLVAVDVGTSAIKAILVDDTGATRASTSRRVPRTPNQPLDPDALWDTVARTIAELGPELADATGIVVTAQGDGLWTIDGSGRPAGPAYEWNDVRAAPIVERWAETGLVEEHYRATGTVLWPGTTAALWCWLEQHDPEHAARTATVFYAKDWINHRLSGAAATDQTDATIPFGDPATGAYHEAAFTRLGCERLSDRMAPIQDNGSVIGEVTDQAAASTGLPVGTPVLMGCLDVMGLMLGAGTVGAGTAGAGDGLAVLGTTAGAGVINSTLITDGAPVGATMRAVQDLGYLRFLGASSGTSTLDWYLDAIAGDRDYVGLWNDVGAGRPGPIFLPYLAGERVPFLAPSATGTFIGLRPGTSRADLARSVVLGITFSLRHCLEAATDRGLDSLVLTGGGADSPAWCQIVADVTGREITVDHRADIACHGVARLAGGGDPTTAGRRERFSPQVDHQAEYELFVELGQAMMPIWASASQAEAARP